MTGVESTDFLSVSVRTNSHGIQNIQLTALEDEIALEDDQFKLQYVHTFGEEFFDVVEVGGEFIRHVATVEIIDNDRKHFLVTTYFVWNINAVTELVTCVS